MALQVSEVVADDRSSPTDKHTHKISAHVSAYIHHVRTQLKQTIPKAIVHCLVRFPYSNVLTMVVAFEAVMLSYLRTYKHDLFYILPATMLPVQQAAHACQAVPTAGALPLRYCFSKLLPVKAGKWTDMAGVLWLFTGAAGEEAAAGRPPCGGGQQRGQQAEAHAD